MSAVLVQAEARQKEQSTAKIEEALQPHRMTREGLINGGLRHALISFVNENN